MKIKVLLFCVFLFTNILAQDKEPIAQVLVLVTGDESIEGKISSYIKRELRELKDIYVTPPNDSTYYEVPNIYVSIICIKIHLEGDREIGYSLAIHISRSFIVDVYNIEFKSCLDCLDIYNNEVIREYLEITGYPMVPLGSWLRITNMNGLKKLCEEIVADIDNDVFEELR